MSQGQSRIGWLDIVKGIAIIAVIVGRSVAYGSALHRFIFAFHMPLFFLLSGYTFKIKTFKEVASSSAKRLLVPYAIIFFLWQIVYCLLRTPDDLTADSFYRYCMTALFASGTSNAAQGIEQVGMEWFLMCLFVSRILFNQIMRVLQGTRYGALPGHAVVFGLLAALGVGIGSRGGFYLPLSLDVAFIATGFMWCGYAMRERDFVNRYASKWYCMLISLVLFCFAAVFPESSISMAGRGYAMPILQIVGALAGSIIAIDVALYCDGWTARKVIGWPCRYLAFMGRNTMLVFSLHCLDWYIPWSELPALQGLPGQGCLTTMIRVAYNSLFAYLVRKS